MDQLSVPCLRITTTRRAADTVSVAVAGEIDLLTVGELRTGLLAAVASDAITAMELDLSRVGFLDCAGLGALVGIWRDAAQSGTQVVLIAASTAVVRVLTLFDLDVTFGYRRPLTIAHRWWQRPLFFRRRAATAPSQPAREARLSA